MKRKIFVLSFLLSGLFFFVATRAMADCPPNWDSRAIFVPVNGCLYLVEYCYKCGVTGPDPSNVVITYYGRLPREQQPNPENCSDDEVDIEIIKEAVRQHYYIDCTIPNCSTNVPLKIILEYPLCRTYHNRAWVDQNGVKHHFFWEESCNNGLYYCQIIRYCCKIENQGNVTYECFTTQVVPQGNSMSCGVKPPIPPPPFTWDDSWDTDCVVAVPCEEIK